MLVALLVYPAYFSYIQESHAFSQDLHVDKQKYQSFRKQNKNKAGHTNSEQLFFLRNNNAKVKPPTFYTTHF